METPEVYGRLGAAAIALDTPESQRASLGLFLTAGVANRFRNLEITEAEARQQIETIIQTGQIPDPSALKAVSDALSGAPSLEQVQLDGFLDETFKGFGILAAPFFATPPGALTISIIAGYGAPFVKYLQDPNNIFTGQFAPPRIEPVLVAGAVALAQLDRIARQKAELAQIYRDLVPETSIRIKFGESDPAQSLAASLAGELSAPIQRLLQAGQTEIGDALNELETGIYQRLDAVEGTTKEVLALLKEEKNTRERQEKIEKARQRERLIQQEVAGAITVLDAFTRFVVGDPETARKVTGCLQAAQSAYQLITSFVGGSLGPLGLAGGLVTVLQNVFGLFGGGPDPIGARLDEIDKKLDRMTQILINGFEHLDRRLVDVLNLSRVILGEVILTGQVLQARIAELEQRVDFLTDIVISDARNDFEAPVEELATRTRVRILAGESLEPTILDDLSLLMTHARKHSREVEMNGRLSNPTASGISVLLQRSPDIRTATGNLQFVVGMAHPSITLADPNPPDIKHWSHVVQGVQELLVLVPGVNIDVTTSFLRDLWRDGNNVKSSVLAATNPDLLLSLLDLYEAAALRERSNAGVARTLDEQITGLLREPVSFPLQQHIENKVLLLPPQSFLDVGPAFRYLLSILTWRISNVGDELSVNPRAVDMVADRLSLSSFLVEALARSTPPEGGVDAIIETTNGQPRLRTAISDAVLQEFRHKITIDVDRLRSSLPAIAQSRRVRDVDEALLGINAAARSRGISLADLTAPLLRIPPRTQPGSVYEVSGPDLARDLRNLCEAAAEDFSTEQGDVVDASTGLRRLTLVPLGLSGLVLPKSAAENPDGGQTYARVVLPAPTNMSQALEQVDRYEQHILATFPGISRFELPLLPGYVRRADAATTLQQSFRYYSRALDPSDPPSEIALLTREVSDGDANSPGFSRFALEIWIFTRNSGAIRHDVDVTN